MAKAQWSIDLRRVTKSTDADGTQHLTVPLYDTGVHVATLRVQVTESRALTVEWVSEPVASRLSDFRAWSKEA